ncbi:MAG: hypothetical protein AAF551_04640 [Bacteroidota bacterium]
MEISDSRHKQFQFLFRLSCFLIFFGRAWQHLVWDAPFRAFFWDEGLLEGIVTSLLGVSWFDYVTSTSTDLFITVLTRVFGVFYLIMAGITLVISPKMKKLGWLYYLASAFLAILAILYCKEKFYHTAQFFEYAIQFLTPVFFMHLVFNKTSEGRLILFSKIAIALTFISHGMYAFGYYPRPGVFVDMTINTLGVSEDFAHQFLWIAGVLDFVVGVGIFLPRVGHYFMLYAVVWGLGSAIARTWANVTFGPYMFPLLNQYLNQTLYRLPHGLIPLALYLVALKPIWRRATSNTAAS